MRQARPFGNLPPLEDAPSDPPLVRAAREFIEAHDAAHKNWQTSDWSETIEKRKALMQAVKEYEEGQRVAILSSEVVEGLCQSPIETRMLKALRYELPRMGAAMARWGFSLPNVDCIANGVYIAPQAQIGPYRADFLIDIRHSSALAQVLVECDGHEFHERTKEQAAHDKARDRWFQERDITVFRYPGSEIYKDAAKCAAQVSRFVLERSISLMAPASLAAEVA